MNEKTMKSTSTILIENGYAYEVQRCEDNHEHGEWVRGEAEADLRDRDRLMALTDDNVMLCVAGLTLQRLPYDETQRYPNCVHGWELATDSMGRYHVRLLALDTIFDRAKFYGTNASINGKRIYAERLRAPFLGFTYRIVEDITGYSHCERFARFDEVDLPKWLPFSYLRVWGAA